MLTPDVRFEGWTTADWIRFVGLWKPRAAPEREPSRPRGGIVVVHEDGQILKLLHTQRGRLDPSQPAASAAEADARAVGLMAGQPAALGEVARLHHAAWVLSLRLGALDEVMERFGARARRGDDVTDQGLQLVGIVRELMVEGAIASYPQRLRGLPVPTSALVRRTFDALCPDGRAMVLGVFDEEGLWTSLTARRRADGFDVIAGPDELRPALGLLSGDWRRDYRHLVRAVEERYAPLAFGCFAELGRFRSLQTDPTPGAWTRAVAVRDVIVSPMPVAVGVGLGIDGARYAAHGVRVLTGRLVPMDALAPLAELARAGVARVTGKDIGSLLGFDPLAVLRALLER